MAGQDSDARWTIVIWGGSDDAGDDSDEPVRWELTDEPDFAHPTNDAVAIYAAVYAAMGTWPTTDRPDANVRVTWWPKEDVGDTYGWVRVRDGEWQFRFGHDEPRW